MNRSLTLLPLIAFIVGCASTVRLYEGPVRPESELALLDPSSRYLKAEMTSSNAYGGGGGIRIKTISTEPQVYLIAVDGRSVPGNGNKPLEIEPGKHLLKTRMVAQGTNELVETSIDVKPGVLYSVEAVLDESSGRWIVQVKAKARWGRG